MSEPMWQDRFPPTKTEDQIKNDPFTLEAKLADIWYCNQTVKGLIALVNNGLGSRDFYVLENSVYRWIGRN